jgi:di/tricarboxylate transporter
VTTRDAWEIEVVGKVEGSILLWCGWPTGYVIVPDPEHSRDDVDLAAVFLVVIGVAFILMAMAWPAFRLFDWDHPLDP